jgi:hypothetical protein
MSVTFEDIPIAIPPEDKIGILSFSMPLEMSLSMSISDFHDDGVGDWWWLKCNMSYGDHLTTEEQDFTIFSMPTDGITVPVEEAFDSLSLSVHAASISMSVSFEDIPIAIPPEDKTVFLSFSMPPEVSLNMSISNFGKDGVGDWRWLKCSMSYDDCPMSMSLSLSIEVPSLDQSGTDFDAEESFSNYIEEFEFLWAIYLVGDSQLEL